MPRQRQDRGLAGRQTGNRTIGDRVEERVDPLAGLRRYRKFRAGRRARRRRVRQVELRPDDERRARDLGRARRCAVVEPQGQVGALRPLPRAPDALLLDRVAGVANPGGIDQDDRITAEIDRDLDGVARRAREGRGDGDVASGDRVHQGRLADIRRPGDHHDEPCPQPLRGLRARQSPIDAIHGARGRPRGSHPPSRTRRPPRRKSRVAPRPSPSRPEAALEWRRTPVAARRPRSAAPADAEPRSPPRRDRQDPRPRRDPSCRSGTRATRIRRARPRRSPGTAARARATAAGTARPPVTLQLHDLLAGKASRSGEPDDQRPIERDAGHRIDQRPHRRDPIREDGPPRQGRERRRGERPGDAEDRDSGLSDAARLRKNRVLIVFEQGRAPLPDLGAPAFLRRRRRYFHGGVQTTYWSAIASWSPCFSRWK